MIGFFGQAFNAFCAFLSKPQATNGIIEARIGNRLSDTGMSCGFWETEYRSLSARSFEKSFLVTGSNRSSLPLISHGKMPVDIAETKHTPTSAHFVCSSGKISFDCVRTKFAEPLTISMFPLMTIGTTPVVLAGTKHTPTSAHFVCSSGKISFDCVRTKFAEPLTMGMTIGTTPVVLAGTKHKPTSSHFVRIGSKAGSYCNRANSAGAVSIGMFPLIPIGKMPVGIVGTRHNPTSRHFVRIGGKAGSYCNRTNSAGAVSIGMFPLLLLLLIVNFCNLALVAAPAVAKGTGMIKESILHEGYKRDYYVHAPPNYNPEVPTPVLLVFHQEGSDSKSMSKLAQFNQLSDQYGFLVVYPQGISGLWNDGRRTDALKLNDVGFVSDLINMLERKWRADKNAVYACGYSDGGFFAQYLALRLPGRINAVASVAGTMSQVMVNKMRLKGNCSVLYILGMDDEIVPFKGGPIDPQRNGRYRGMGASASECINFWVRGNKCGGDFTQEDYPGVDGADGITVKVARYQNCPRGYEVAIYAIQGGGHAWPRGRSSAKTAKGKTSRDFDATDAIFRFFAEHGLVRQQQPLQQQPSQ